MHCGWKMPNIFCQICPIKEKIGDSVRFCFNLWFAAVFAVRPSLAGTAQLQCDTPAVQCCAHLDRQVEVEVKVKGGEEVQVKVRAVCCQLCSHPYPTVHWRATVVTAVGGRLPAIPSSTGCRVSVCTPPSPSLQRPANSSPSSPFVWNNSVHNGFELTLKESLVGNRL